MEISEKQVRTLIEEAAARLLDENKKFSSTKLSRNASGKLTFEVKVYDMDPVIALNKARRMERALSEEYLGISDNGGPDVQLPDYDTDNSSHVDGGNEDNSNVDIPNPSELQDEGNGNDSPFGDDDEEFDFS